jgi:hypothetical protein
MISVMRLKSRLHVRRRNSSRVRNNLPCSCRRVVRNLQKEVAILKSTSQEQPVDELSSPNLHTRRRFPVPAVQDDDEASCYIDGFGSDYADDTDSAKV